MGVRETIALVGPPNSGKTTLFNWLTDSNVRAVNYAGATVDCMIANIATKYGEQTQFLDTPGTYSIFAQTEDEKVTQQALFEHPEYKIKKVVVVVDATQLSRELQTVEQLRESGFGLVVAMTMIDLLPPSESQSYIDKISQLLQVPVVGIDGLHGKGIDQLVKKLGEIGGEVIEVKQTPRWSEERLKSFQRKVEGVIRGISQRQTIDPTFITLTKRLDRLLLSSTLGLPFFMIIMFALFSAIFWAAQPFMDGIDSGFSWAVDKAMELGGGSLWGEFLADGIIASFGSVLIFVPQIFILFAGISFLESSGYLARAATLVDRPLSYFGLGGRSFVPLLSGFACAVPAMMATRTISSRRERWLTMFIIPIMTCSARLPVYALLLAFLFSQSPAWYGGLAMAAIYFFALFVGAIAAKVLAQIIPQSQRSLFLLELPLYRRPTLMNVVHQAWQRTVVFIKRAGAPIFIFSLIIWAGSTFPNYEAASNQEKLESSYIGRVGHYIEPIVAPMGADWRVGVGLVSAFAAREVFVSSLAIIFNVDSDDESTLQSSLLTSMSSAVNSRGEKIFTFASVMALIVFFTIALQCTSTTAMAAKEMGSWKFAMGQLVALNIFAYFLAVATYQLLS